MKTEHGHYIVESFTDFASYEIVFCEEHKPGVFKVGLKIDLKEHAKFLIAFSKKEFLPNDIEAHNKYWCHNRYSLHT